MLYTERIFAMCDEFLMFCTLLTAFCIHLCVLFSGTRVHLVATLTGYVDILLNRIAFLESMFDNLFACSMASMR